MSRRIVLEEPEQSDNERSKTMGFAAHKEQYDAIQAVNEVVTDESTNVAMPRRQRRLLYDMEDALARASEALGLFMDEAYGRVAEYRQWGIREGWVDPETDEEWDYERSIRALFSSDAR
jgi:hypothetical protein